MKKILLLVSFAILSNLIFSQDLSYKEFTAKAAKDKNLKPMYGHEVRTDAEIKADKKNLEKYKKENKTDKELSIEFVDLGFKYLRDDNSESAMKKFNQAWMLDSLNSNAYWGFGAIYAAYSDFDNAKKYFDLGLKLDPSNSFILGDYGNLYLVNYFNKAQNISDIDIAMTYLNKSYGINPKNDATIYHLVICNKVKDDCPSASKLYNEYKEIAKPKFEDSQLLEFLKKCNP